MIDITRIPNSLGFGDNLEERGATMTKKKRILAGILLLFIPVGAIAWLTFNGIDAHDVNFGLPMPKWIKATASEGALHLVDANPLHDSLSDAMDGTQAESLTPSPEPYIVLLLVTGIVGLAGGSRKL